jgi:hypothetical protein
MTYGYTVDAAEVASGAVSLVGAQLYYGTSTTTYTNDSFTQLGGLISLPAVGAAYDLVSVATLAGEKKAFGLKKFGGGDFLFNFIEASTGQQAVPAMVGAPTPINWALVLANKATSTGTGTTLFFKGTVFAFDAPNGGASASFQRKLTLQLQTDVTYQVAS